MEAVSIAKEADFVIIVAGLDLSQETEDRDRYSLLLPGFQKALVTTIAAVSEKPLVLVLTGGGPLDVSFAEGDPRIASILWIGYPGEAGGKALAEVIFGDYNPGWYKLVLNSSARIKVLQTMHEKVITSLFPLIVRLKLFPEWYGSA